MLVVAVYQRESAVHIRISPSSWTPSFHQSRSSQSTKLDSLKKKKPTGFIIPKLNIWLKRHHTFPSYFNPSLPPSFYLELSLHTNTKTLYFLVTKSSMLDQNLKPLHFPFSLCQEYFPSPFAWSVPLHHALCLRMESPSFRKPPSPSPPEPGSCCDPDAHLQAVSSIRLLVPVNTFIVHHRLGSIHSRPFKIMVKWTH